MKTIVFCFIFFTLFNNVSYAAEIPQETLNVLYQQLLDIQIQLDILKSSNTITFSELPLTLQKVAICESGARHNIGNKVIISHTGDVGIMQINLKAHKKTAQNMGLNLFNANDNMKFGLWLYNKNGLYDWVCARKMNMV